MLVAPLLLSSLRNGGGKRTICWTVTEEENRNNGNASVVAESASLRPSPHISVSANTVIRYCCYRRCRYSSPSPHHILVVGFMPCFIYHADDLGFRMPRRKHARKRAIARLTDRKIVREAKHRYSLQFGRHYVLIVLLFTGGMTSLKRRFRLDQVLGDLSILILVG